MNVSTTHFIVTDYGSVQNSDPIINFKKKFMQLIQSGQFDDANDFLCDSCHLHKQLQQSEAFKAMLEEMLERTNRVINLEKQYNKTITLCRIIEQQHFDTQFSCLCEAACLLATGNADHTKSLIENENYPINVINQWIRHYRDLSNLTTARLFTQLQNFMHQLLVKKKFLSSKLLIKI